MKSTKNSNTVLAISIIAYKNPKDIYHCLNSLQKINNKNLFVLVRDHSTEYHEAKKIEEICIKFDFVQYYNPKTNDGFVAHNHNIEILKDKGFEYFLLLNPDCIIRDKNFVSELLKVSIKYKNLCLIQPIIKDFDGTVGNQGNIAQFIGMGGQREITKVLFTDGIANISIASGACLFFSLKTLQTLKHLLANVYFMYHEDTDLSLRAHILDIPVLCISTTEIYHDHKFGKSRLKFLYLDRNKLIFIFSYYRWWEILIILPSILIGGLLGLIFGIINGWFDLKFEVYRSLYKNRKKILQERNQIQKLLNQYGRKKLFNSIESNISTKDLGDNKLIKFGIEVINIIFLINWKVFRLLTSQTK